MFGDSIGRSVDHFVVLARLAIVADHIECVFVDLLDYELHSAHAPNVVHVPNVDLRANFEFANLAFFLTLDVLFSPIVPVLLDCWVLAIIDKLVDDVVNFETHAAGSVPHHLAFHREKVAHEAGLKEKTPYVRSQFRSLPL